jgi:hypothetical protein
MKSRVLGIVGFLMLGMSVMSLPVEAASITDARQLATYSSSTSGQPHGVVISRSVAPVSAALGLIGLAMIGVVVIGRRL